MDKRVISVIQEYMFDLFEPARNWPKYEFRQRSYARWAATEILELVKRNPDAPSVEVVEQFAKRMNEYSCIDHYDRNDSFIFSVAYDVATDISDILRAMN